MATLTTQPESIPLANLTGNTKPDEWLEWARRKLRFRSHRAMHRALADAAGLDYCCIHEALSRPNRTTRIPSPAKHCLQRWLEKVTWGEDIHVDDRYRAVPVEQLKRLLPRLNGKFRTGQELYRCTAEDMAPVRRYFRVNGELTYAPLNLDRPLYEAGMLADAVVFHLLEFWGEQGVHSAAHRGAGPKGYALRQASPDRIHLLELGNRADRRRATLVGLADRLCEVRGADGRLLGWAVRDQQDRIMLEAPDGTVIQTLEHVQPREQLAVR